MSPVADPDAGEADGPREPSEEDVRVDAALSLAEAILDDVGARVGVSRETLIRELRRRAREEDEG